MQSLSIEFHPVARPLADSAAEFKARFKISLADAFAAALGAESPGSNTGDSVICHPESGRDCDLPLR
jgi:hypothetical protein